MIQKRVQVKGLVQGVGFRPFIYNLALKYDLNGWVNNDDKGVNILLSSLDEKAINSFLLELKNNPPPLAKIDEIHIKDEKKKRKYNSFEIKKSENSNNKSTIISPDICICEDCISDINDENNFRYDYALTNCTNCGPRYSIIKTVPYDRCNTSMALFELCNKCKKEYEYPTNRRYHAQPVACEECGPQVMLYDNQKNKLSSNIDAIKQIANLINSGKIVAIKGMGGFHIVCDATNEDTIKNLREKKNRPSKPFAVMFKNLQEIKKHTVLSQKEEDVISSKEKPIVIVNKNDNNKICDSVASKINRLGVFLPYTPLHFLLFRYLNNPIIATSANLKDEPIIKCVEDIFTKLSNSIDYVLDFNREIINACDDSIVQVVNNDVQILRLARGYTPLSFKTQIKFDKNILSLGANQKNSISIGFENNIISSPYIGDLNSIVSMEYFQRSVETFKRFYDFEPELIICDKHPNYETTKWAKLQNKELIQIQHHYAHVLSCMLENNIDEDVLAFVFDGTGYGDDGNIWGGEVFIANRSRYKRLNHINYFKLLGGEKAVKEPKRIALSLLFDNFTLEEVLSLDNACVNSFSNNEIVLLHMMWQKKLNAPLSSSFGRFFDAIASFSDILQIQTYEGQTGLLIEKEYDENIKESYEYELVDNQIDLSKAIFEVLEDTDKKMICSKFINMIINIIYDISFEHKNLKVILSGGVFQNKTLLEQLSKKFKNEKREFYYSKKIPLNDQGISLGQLYYKKS
ncbi:MAG: carbamoyltransferase HypF [Arcobacter sp.]|uniref:carbamoyltransferase HypF n=1 Tax=Arcobacter sp. TaxID=1872629 RepID=UPI003AFF99F3